MNDEEIVNDFVQKINKGEITFDKVRMRLQELGMEEERIKQIVRRVDNDLQASLTNKSTASSLDQVILLGYVLLIIGALFTLTSLTGLFASGERYLIIAAYGSLIAGLVLVFIGMRRKKKQSLNAGPQSLKRKFRLRDKEDDGGVGG